MNQLAQEAVLVALARQLEEKGSWTGETHLQKAAYLLSEIGGVDFDFRFILYKYGPFSFELRDELAAMREDGLLEQRTQDPRYGPRLVVTERGTAHQARFSKTLDRYRKSLDFIAEALGSRGVMDLERLATAMWVTRKAPEATVRQRAEALVDVKSHIDLDNAVEAVEEIDRLLAANCIR